MQSRSIISACFSLLVFCTLPVGCDRGNPRQSSHHDDLNHFDGVIDNSDFTYDTFKSDLYVRAGQHLKDGDVDAAKVLYKKAIEKYPDDPDGFTALGASFCFERNYEDARTQYLRALEVDASCASAYYGLGCVAYDQQQYDLAIDYLSKALDIAEADGDYHRVLGMAFDANGDVPKAIAHYERTLALNPNDDSVRGSLRRLAQQPPNRITKP